MKEFPPFRLDPDNQCLWRRTKAGDDERIRLTPKAFAVLQYLVEHAGRRGSLRLKAHDKDIAEVCFGDGSRDLVNMKELRLVCWATEA